MSAQYSSIDARRVGHADRERERHPHHSGAGHWIRIAGTVSPLLIGELVKDPEKRWRFIRISSVAMAVIGEGLCTHKLQQERNEREWERTR
jgi:hypothetical protein